MRLTLAPAQVVRRQWQGLGCEIDDVDWLEIYANGALNCASLQASIQTHGYPSLFPRITADRSDHRTVQFHRKNYGRVALSEYALEKFISFES